MYIILLTLLLLIPISCKPAQTEKKLTLPVQPIVTDKDECDWVLSCWFVVYPETWMDSVLVKPKIAINQHDYCVISILHSLEEGIKNGSCPRCMEVLNAITNVADGYVGELLGGIAKTLYEEEFEIFIKFLADPKYDSENLLQQLVWEFQLDLPGKRNPEQSEKLRASFINDIQQKMRDKKRTDAEVQVLSKLEQKVREIKVN